MSMMKEVQSVVSDALEVVNDGMPVIIQRASTDALLRAVIRLENAARAAHDAQRLFGMIRRSAFKVRVDCLRELQKRPDIRLHTCPCVDA